MREGKPLESCVFDGDTLETTFHLGIFVENKLVGVCSFLKSSHELIKEKHQYQLRGMAVLKSFQSLGLGKIILNHGETLLKQEGIKIIWCNAREVAAGFYKNNQYSIIGEPFNIKNIGLHFVMFKTLY